MLDINDNPWLGLASYENKDSYRFFGRNDDIVELESAIANNPFTTIYGISGAGKTSLINAGLCPKLATANYLPIRKRLEHESTVGYGTQIIQALQTAIEAIGGEIESFNALADDEIADNERLWNFLFTSKFWSKTNHQLVPVVFIDQFEEIFTKNDEADRIVEFFETINSLQYNRPPEKTLAKLEEQEGYVSYNDTAHFRLVLSLREDFLARLEDYSYNIPALRKNRKGIKRMNGYQALEVILKPYPGIITHDDALLILEKVTGTKVVDQDKCLSRLSVDTSILSLFCSELYQKAVARNADTITKALIEEFGDNIISSFYNETMKGISSRSVEYLETHLLTHSGFRNSMAKEDLLQNGIKEKELEHLAKKRLVRIETFEKVERVEFTHDVLCAVAKQHRDNRILQGSNVLNIKFFVETTMAAILVGVLILMLPSCLWQTPLLATIGLMAYFALTCFSPEASLAKKGYTYLAFIAVAAVGLFAYYKILEYDIPYKFAENSYTLFWERFAIPIGVGAILLLGAFIKEDNLVARNLKKALWLAAIVLALWFCRWRLSWIFTIAAIVYIFYVLLPNSFARDKKVAWLHIAAAALIILIGWRSYSINSLSSDETNSIIKLVAAYLAIEGICMLLAFRSSNTNVTLRELMYVGCRYIVSSQWKKACVCVQATLVLMALAVLTGLRLNDALTLIVVPACATASFVAALWAFGGKKIELKWSALMAGFVLVLVAGVLALQYVPYRGWLQYSAWFVAGGAAYMLIERKRKADIAKQASAINKWALMCAFALSTVLIPVLGMGYNAFMAPSLSRVYGGATTLDISPERNSLQDYLINPTRSLQLFRLQTADGRVGLYDRGEQIIPAQYKLINQEFGIEEYRIELEKDNDIAFALQKPDGTKETWCAIDHLADENLLTKTLASAIDYNISSDFYYFYFRPSNDILYKYFDYLNSKERFSAQWKVDNIVTQNLRVSIHNYDLVFYCISDIQNYIDSIDVSSMVECLNHSYTFFSYIDDMTLHYEIPQLLNDLLPQCANYDEDTFDFASSATWRLYARDYVGAICDAYKSLKQDPSPYNAAYVPLICALYMEGNTDSAFVHLSMHRDIWGDAIYDQMQDLVRFGICQDTTSPNYKELMSIAKQQE